MKNITKFSTLISALVCSGVLLPSSSLLAQTAPAAAPAANAAQAKAQVKDASQDTPDAIPAADNNPMTVINTNLGDKPGGAPKVYDLRAAVETALALSPLLKQTRETINQAGSNTDLVRSYLFPTLTYNFNGGTAAAATIDTPSPLFGGTPYNTYQGDLQLVQPLFAYGSLSAVKNADYGRRLNMVNVELAERTLITNVIQSFYSIILNRKLLTFLEETKPVVQKSLDVSNYRYKIGRAQLLDVLQAKTQLALLQPQIDQARNNFMAAGVQLAAYMGLDNVSQVSVKGQLRTLLYKDVARHLDLKNFYLPEFEQNKLQAEQLEQSKEQEMGKYWPVVKFVGNAYQTSYTQADFTNPAASSWSALVNVSIPIFEGLASRYDSAVYASEQIQLNHARHQLEETVYSSQVTSKTALDTAEVSMISAVEADKLAQASLNEAIRQYRLATIDYLQFLTIEQSALTAKSQVETLRYNSIVAYASYFAAMGQPMKTLVEILNSGEKP